MSESKQINSQQDDEPEDPVDSMLKKTGCTELHYKVQVFHHISNRLEQVELIATLDSGFSPSIPYLFYSLVFIGVHCRDAGLEKV